MTDREIIDLIIQRDEKGLSELLKHYGPMIRYIITPVYIIFMIRRNAFQRLR